MNKTASRTVLTAFLALATLLVGAAVAWACTDQAVIGTPGAGPNGGSALQPNWGPPGTKVLVEGREFRQKQVEIRWNSASGKLLATGQGPSFSEEFLTPDRPPGDYTVVALQRDHNGDVDALASAAFKVTQGSASPDGGGPGSASGSGSGGPASSEAGRTTGSASGGGGARQPEGGQTTAAASGSGAHDGDRQAGRTSESASGGQAVADPRPGGEIGGEPNQSGDEPGGSRQPQPAADDGRQGARDTAGEREQVGSGQPAGGQPDAAASPAPDPQRGQDRQAAPQPDAAPTPPEDAASEPAAATEPSSRPSDVADEAPAADSGQEEPSSASSAPDRQPDRGRPRTPSTQSATEDLWSGLAPSDSPGLPDGQTAPTGSDSLLSSGLALGVALLGGGLVLLGGFTATTLRRRRTLAHTHGQ